MLPPPNFTIFFHSVTNALLNDDVSTIFWCACLCKLFDICEGDKCSKLHGLDRMTVKYNLDVSTSRPWTLFKLLLKWRGSVWKSVIFELIVWLILFALFSVVYRFALNSEQKKSFESVVAYFDEKLKYIPLDFMLGFFVTSVLNRWNTFFAAIGYIDNIALMVAAYVRGTDEKTRKMRRNIVRYCVLSQALVFRDLSMRVRKRFPTIETLIAAGFMMEHEKSKFDEIQYRYAKYWMPFQWALALCDEARQQQRIASDFLLQKVGEEIRLFRTNMAILCNYDWVPLPIMYPQLIVLAVHVYFLVCSFSRQFIVSDGAPNKSRVDLVFPIMTVLQFVFYMGWLKVAEVILNPFGEDDDDFECNFLLDKNITIGLTIVDEGYGKTPQMIPDVFWNKPVEPLYTVEAAQTERRTSGITGSTAHVRIPERRMSAMIPLSHEEGTNPSFGMRFRNRSALSAGERVNLSEQLYSNGVANGNAKFLRSMSHVPASFSSPYHVADRRNLSASNLQTLEHGGRFPNFDAMFHRRRSSGIRTEVINEFANRNDNATTGESPIRQPEMFAHVASVTRKLEDLAEETEENMSNRNTVIKQQERNVQSVDLATVAARLAGIIDDRPPTPVNASEDVKLKAEISEKVKPKADESKRTAEEKRTNAVSESQPATPSAHLGTPITSPPRKIFKVEEISAEALYLDHPPTKEPMAKKDRKDEK